MKPFFTLATTTVRTITSETVLRHHYQQQLSRNVFRAVSASPSVFPSGLPHRQRPQKTRILSAPKLQQSIITVRNETFSSSSSTNNNNNDNDNNNGKSNGNDNNKTMPDTTTNLWSIGDCLTEWKTDASKIRFVDATFYRKDGRTGRESFEEGPRLPGAFLWDMNELSASAEDFPGLNPKNLSNVYPPPWFIGRALEKTLGRESEAPSPPAPKTTLVIYGRKGTMFLPRIWCLLKWYCHPDLFDIKVLQGSMEDWIAAGGPIEEGPNPDRVILAKDLLAADPSGSTNDGEAQQQQQHPLVSPTARNKVVDMKFVLDLFEKRDASDRELPSTIIDTRGPGAYKDGHIPGASNVPFASFWKDGDPLTLKPRDELLGVLTNKLAGSGVDVRDLRTTPPLLSCGAAVSLCTVALVFDELGFPAPWVYDGSWNEWGQDPSTPKEKVTE